MQQFFIVLNNNQSLSSSTVQFKSTFPYFAINVPVASSKAPRKTIFRNWYLLRIVRQHLLSAHDRIELLLPKTQMVQEGYSHPGFNR
jgi:hypothetical protein